MTKNGHNPMNGSQSHERRTCGAKTRSGHPCKLPPVPGRDRCRFHGGAQRRGINHHNTKHGRYSKDIPTRLQARYLDAISDPDLLALNSEIGLVDTRIAELLTGIDTEASTDLWMEVGKHVAALRKAGASGDTTGMAFAIQTLETLAAKGLEMYSMWADITGLVEQRRKLVDTERKHRHDMQQMITAERAMLLVSAIAGIVIQHVPDSDTRHKISTDIGTLLTTGAPVAVDAISG